MVEKSLARLKLEQSYFFKNCALEAIPTQQRIAFSTFIEITIVFICSVTFYLQKEYSHKPDVYNWYSGKREIIKKDPIFDFSLMYGISFLKKDLLEFLK